MWYNFRQNNSGGSFVLDEDNGLSVNVWIEADSYAKAERRAQGIGIYFNGVEDDLDCECCGDRWYQSYDGEGTDVPELYGMPVYEASTVESLTPADGYTPMKWIKDGPEGYLHYADGRVVGVLL